MKLNRVSFYAMVAATTMFVACSDYKGEITKAHEDYEKAIARSSEDYLNPSTASFHSGCVCKVDYSNLIPVVNSVGYTDLFYDPRSIGPVSWWIEDCSDALSFGTDVNIPKEFWVAKYQENNRLDLTISEGGRGSAGSVSGNVTFYPKNIYGVSDTVSCPNVAFGLTPDAAEIIQPSGSATPVASSSSVQPSLSNKIPCGDLWCGPTDTQGKVETGSDDETAGYWYDYNDSDDGGNSSISYPADVEANEYDNFFGPLIEAYGGIKGSVVLGDGYVYPYAGLAFNLVSGNQEGTDISSWGGICLVYSSNKTFAIELQVEDYATVTNFNSHKATVARSEKITTIDYPWSKFKQESGWGIMVERETALKNVATIKLKFSGTAGTNGDFVFYSIGRYGTCQ